MKEFKALTESQLELLHMKNMQIQDILNQAQTLQKQNMARIERMKIELDILPAEINQWQFSKDGKGFEREKPIKQATVKGNKNKK